MLTDAGWFKHRDRVAWWNMATDERSSTRNIFKEAHKLFGMKVLEMVNECGIPYMKR